MRSTGVPGVPLVGAKNSPGSSLQTYGTLESVFEHVEEISGAKRKQNLIDHRQQVMLSRQLVRLDTDVPIEIDWPAARTGRIDRPAVSELFARLGIRRLAEKFDALAATPENLARDARKIVAPPNSNGCFDEGAGRMPRKRLS